MSETFNHLDDDAGMEREFQRLWKLQKEGVPDSEYFQNSDIEQEFQIKTSVDWETLQKVAIKRTLLEKMWYALGNVSGRRFAIAGTFAFLATPMLLILTYKWSSFKLEQGGNINIVAGILVMAAAAGLATMVIGAALYLLHKKTVVPAYKSRSIVKAIDTLSWAACVVVIGLSALNIVHFDNYKKVDINGAKKAIAKEYVKVLQGDDYLVWKFADSLKVSSEPNQDPELYNAIGVGFEKKGKKYEAEVAYTKAAKSDPFDQVSSYKKNRAKENVKPISKEKLCYIEEVDRFVSPQYCQAFSSPVNVKHLLDTVPDIKDAGDGNNLSLLNALAVAYEYVGKKDSANFIYRITLNTSKTEDPLLMVNARRFIDQNAANWMIVDTTNQHNEKKQYQIIPIGAPR